VNTKSFFKKTSLIIIVSFLTTSCTELRSNRDRIYRTYTSPIEAFTKDNCDLKISSSYVSATIKIPRGDTVKKGNSLIQGATKRYFIEDKVLYKTPLQVTTYERYKNRYTYNYPNKEIFYICSHKKNLYIENKRVLRHKYRQHRDEIVLELSEF
jgi:hypothetical protein